MKAVAWMAAASLVSAALAVAVVGRHMGAEVLLGMLAPLGAAGVSWTKRPCSATALATTARWQAWSESPAMGLRHSSRR